jgi:hypothetical protein
LAATEKLTLPLPLADDPEVICIQLTLLTALHEQPVAVRTVAVPPPDVASTEKARGETSKRHGAADCLTAARLLLTTMSP